MVGRGVVVALGAKVGVGVADCVGEEVGAWVAVGNGIVGVEMGVSATVVGVGVGDGWIGVGVARSPHPAAAAARSTRNTSVLAPMLRRRTDLPIRLLESTRATSGGLLRRRGELDSHLRPAGRDGVLPAAELLGALPALFTLQQPTEIIGRIVEPRLYVGDHLGCRPPGIGLYYIAHGCVGALPQKGDLPQKPGVCPKTCQEVSLWRRGR